MTVLQKICEKITDHKYRKYEGYTDRKPKEYYYRCKICKLGFWDYKKPK